MSTRCQIGFYESKEADLKKWEALVYRHMDGYPEGILPDIIPILEDFNANRGLDDSEYASAWLVKNLKSDYLNIGICKGFHGDIQYYYAVYPNRIEVYKVSIPWDSRKRFADEWFALIKTVKLNGKAVR